MSTRGVIAYAVNFLETPKVSKKYEMGLNYLHYDSYLEEAGVILLTYYSNIRDIRKLVTYSAEGIKSLEREFEKCKFLEDGDTLEEYKDIEPKEILVKFMQYIKSFGGDIEFAYIFLDYTWYVWIKYENCFTPLTFKLLPTATSFIYENLSAYTRNIETFLKEIQ